MRRGLRFWVSVIAFVFLLDRICKWLAVTQWSQEQISILPGVDALLLLNPGIAFSIPLTGRFAVALTAIIMAIVLLECVIAIRKRDAFAFLALAAVMLGALSNAADRVLYGGVVDYLRIGPLPVFNIADLLVLAGMLALLFRPRPQHSVDS